MRTREEAINKLFSYSFAMEFNMNDAFYWGFADSCRIDSFDLISMMSVIQKYDYDALLAYEAIRRGHDPQLPLCTEEFKLAKEDILELLKQDKLYELKNDLEEKN